MFVNFNEHNDEITSNFVNPEISSKLSMMKFLVRLMTQTVGHLIAMKLV